MPDLTAVFAALREVIAPYAATLDTRQDYNSGIYVDTRHIPKNRKPLFFGTVQIRKSYVSFHLILVYLIRKLAALTKAGYDSFRELGFFPQRRRFTADVTGHRRGRFMERAARIPGGVA